MSITRANRRRRARQARRLRAFLHKIDTTRAIPHTWIRLPHIVSERGNWTHVIGDYS